MAEQRTEVSTSAKRVAINMIANLLAFGVQFGINILLTPYIIDNLGSEAYAFVPLSNNIASYASIITVALSSMSSRFISVEYNRGDVEKAGEYFNSVLIANLIMAAFLTIPSIFIVVFSEHILSIPAGLGQDVKMTLGFALAGMLVSVLFSVYSNAYFVKNRLDMKARNNIGGNIVRVIILVLCFCFWKPHIYYLTGTMFLITLGCCLVNVSDSRRLMPEIRFNIRKFRKKAVVILLSCGIWNSVNQLSSVLLSALDLLLANVLIGAEASGVYAVAKTVPNFILSLLGVMVSVFVPGFTVLYAQEKKDELLHSIKLSVKVLGATITLPMAFLMVFGREFFRVWVPSQDVALLHGLSVLTVIPTIVSGGINTLFNVFTVTNRLKIPSIVLLVSGVMNTAITVLLMKCTDIGVWAIPLVSCGILLVKNLTFTPIYAAHCLGEKWYTFYKAIFKSVLCALLMVCVCLVYKRMVSVEGWWGLIMAAGICAFVTSGMNFMVVFDKEEKKKVLEFIRRRIRKER